MTKLLFLMLGIFFTFGDAAQAGLARFQCRLTSQGETMSLEFVHDTITNKAHMVGNNGMSEVYAHVGSRRAYRG